MRKRSGRHYPYLSKDVEGGIKLASMQDFDCIIAVNKNASRPSGPLK